MRGLNIAFVGLLCVCVLGDYAFQSRDLGCDYTIKAVIESTATTNITQMEIIAHGNYRKITTRSILEDKSVYITETIVRPDLATQEGYALEVTYVSGVGIKTTENVIQTTDGTTVYKNRKSVEFNGHKCYMYYNVPGNVIYADEDGYIWGTQQTNNDGEVSTITYKSYDTSKVTADKFTLSSEATSTNKKIVIKSPDASKYAVECRDSNETQVYLVQPPSLGCDLKMMFESDMILSNKTLWLSQTTVYAHGTFLLFIEVSRDNLETTSVVLTRPDQSNNTGMATTYTYDNFTGLCSTIETPLTKIQFDSYVFKHRDEEYYNGFMCYKYYNDSSFEYYVEKAQGLPRAIVIGNESTTRFIYYDFSMLNSTIFVLDGPELAACGVASGEEVNDTIYEDACGPISSSEGNENKESSEKPDNDNDSASVLSLSSIFMLAMILVALFA